MGFASRVGLHGSLHGSVEPDPRRTSHDPVRCGGATRKGDARHLAGRSNHHAVHIVIHEYIRAYIILDHRLRPQIKSYQFFFCPSAACIKHVNKASVFLSYGRSNSLVHVLSSRTYGRQREGTSVGGPGKVMVCLVGKARASEQAHNIRYTITFAKSSLLLATPSCYI